MDMMTGLFKTAKGVGLLELRPAPIPRPKPHEVLLEIKAAGICGTDIHIKQDEFPYYPPVILGHEFSGQIIEVGPEVTDYKIGDRVVGEPHTRACGKCYLCRTGNIQICAAKRSPGWGIDGAFAKYLCMPEHLLHRVPDSLSYEEAAVAEPVANVVQDVLERPRVDPDDFVVIIGPGPIGLLSVMAARAGGAGKIVIIGTRADEAVRLPIAQRIGVDAIILADQDDPVNAVMDLTHGRGADLVVEASGSGRAIYSAVKMIRKMGRLSQIGLTGKADITFPWDAAAARVVTLFFNMSTGFTCWDRALGLMASGKINVKQITTHVFPLERWEEAFTETEAQRAVKALLIP
jgi:L-iditol 2-dehydrogenase